MFKFWIFSKCSSVSTFVLVQVTSFTHAFTMRVFAHAQFYLNIVSVVMLSYTRPRVKAYSCVVPSRGLSGNLVQMTSVTLYNNGTGLISKCLLLYVSSLYAVIHRKATPLYNESHLM
jgi:hypothetical protein